MAVMSVEELYERYIKRRSSSERLRLVEITAHNLANCETALSAEQERPKRSLLELEGLGAEIWEGVDAQEYVNQLRDEGILAKELDDRRILRNDRCSG